MKKTTYFAVSHRSTSHLFHTWDAANTFIDGITTEGEMRPLIETAPRCSLLPNDELMDTALAPFTWEAWNAEYDAQVKQASLEPFARFPLL